MDSELRRLAKILWDYHQLGQELTPCDAGIALGSHDLGVAKYAVELYRDRFYPMIVFTGATSPTTRDRFPRGEAVHSAEYAQSAGVPHGNIVVEPDATNTSENFTLSRNALAARDIHPRSLLVVCKPYMQRRAFTTCKKVWPEVDILCASEPVSLDSYIEQIGDVDLVIDMLVGDTQRVVEYGRRGFAIEQDLPAHVSDAYDELVHRGYTSRMIA